MSESEKKTENKKSPIGAIIIVALILVVGGISLISMQKLKSIDDSDNAIEISSMNVNDDGKEVSGIETASGEEKHEVTSTEIEVKPEITENAGFNLEEASKPRVLGDINAPIKISEHSSFTCGHCAKFHKTNFKEIKRDFIDTGKAYIIYNGFPLNNVDVNIGAISRCVPEKSFFNFVQLLFETQNTWRKAKNILEPIRQNAKLTGASDADLDNCINSEELHQAIVKQREDAINNHKVNATPTLVINDSIVIPGLSSYSKLKEVLDAEYEKATKK